MHLLRQGDLQNSHRTGVHLSAVKAGNAAHFGAVRAPGLAADICG